MTFNPATSYIGEAKGHPKETLKKLAFQAVRRVHVEWADRYNWANFFLYNSDANDYPYFLQEGIPTQSAITKIAIAPDEESRLIHGAGGTSHAQYGYAYLTLVYESVGFNEDDIFIQELRSRFEQIPIINFIGGRPVQDSLIISGHVLTITYPMRAYMPTGVTTLPGLLNLEAFTPLMFPTVMYTTGQMLYVSGDCRGAIHYDGTLRYRVQHHIFTRQIDWNYVWSPYTGTWVLPDWPKHSYTAFASQL